MNVMWLFLTSWLGLARIQDWSPGPWGMHPMWGWWGFWGVGMLLFMFLFWALVVVAIVLGIRWLVRQGRPEISDSALDVLRQRYARGEIDEREFEQRRRALL